MLSVTRFERINGHVPSVVRDRGLGYSAAAKCDCGAVPQRLWVGWFESESAALEDLLERVLAEHRLIATENAKWACQNCGAVTGMAAHHKVLRSRNRDDRVANLVALCRGCHAIEHGEKG